MLQPPALPVVPKGQTGSNVDASPPLTARTILGHITENERIVYQLLAQQGTLAAALDQNIHDMASTDPEVAIRLAVHTQASRAYWDLVTESLTAPGSPQRLVAALGTLRQRLLDLVPGSGVRSQQLRATVNESLDQVGLLVPVSCHLTYRQGYMEHRLTPALDLPYLEQLLGFCMHLLQQLEAPARAATTAKVAFLLFFFYGIRRGDTYMCLVSQGFAGVVSKLHAAAQSTPSDSVAQHVACSMTVDPSRRVRVLLTLAPAWGASAALARAMVDALQFVGDTVDQVTMDVVRVRLEMLQSLLHTGGNGIDYARRCARAKHLHACIYCTMHQAVPAGSGGSGLRGGRPASHRPVARGTSAHRQGRRRSRAGDPAAVPAAHAARRRGGGCMPRDAGAGRRTHHPTSGTCPCSLCSQLCFIHSHTHSHRTSCSACH